MADPTRLRLLALLVEGEATVGELQAILGQSQPRVSRHLKLLADARLVERFRDGHWIYHRLSSDSAGAALVTAAIAQLPEDDPERLGDRAALDRIKRQREREVLAEWPVLPGSRPVFGAATDPASLDSALSELLGEASLGDVLLAGCGNQQLLSWLARHARLLVGIDKRRQARLLARSRAHELGLQNCTIRAAGLEDEGLAKGRFDLVVLNGQLARPSSAAATLNAATQRLRPQGRLLIFDRVLPLRRQLGDEQAALSDGQLTALLAGLGARVVARHWLPGRAPEHALITAIPAAGLERTGTHD